MKKMIDLRTVVTGVRLTRAERLAAEMRHLAAMNDAQLRERKAMNARRGLTVKVPIGTAYVPPNVARTYTHMNVRGLA